MPLPRERNFWIKTTFFYMLLLMVGSLKPNMSQAPYSPTKEMFHNFLHFPAYAVLTFILLNTFKVFDRPRALLPVFLISVGYGGLIEILQGFIPGRMSSWEDLGINTLGTVLVLLFYRC